MNQDFDLTTGRVTNYIGIDDIIKGLQYNYARALFIISIVFMLYVLWNNFIRSPSKPHGIKAAIKDNFNFEKPIEEILGEEEGIEPSIRVKKISRAIDGYMIVPAVFMIWITYSYLISLR